MLTPSFLYPHTVSRSSVRINFFFFFSLLSAFPVFLSQQDAISVVWTPSLDPFTPPLDRAHLIALTRASTGIDIDGWDAPRGSDATLAIFQLQTRPLISADLFLPCKCYRRPIIIVQLVLAGGKVAEFRHRLLLSQAHLHILRGAY